MNLQGLNKQQVEESRQKHGANTLTQIPPEPLWKKILEGFKDPMIMILLVALVIQVVLCFMGEAHWYEPVGILIAIMIANGVSAISENQQEGKASALKAEEEAKEVAKVLRDGKLMEIHVSEVVVGDLVYLQAGDKISADGEIVEGLVKVDQATLNGETKEATKTVNESGEAYNTKDLLNRCYVYRGTGVCSGEAYMEVKSSAIRRCSANWRWKCRRIRVKRPCRSSWPSSPSRFRPSAISARLPSSWACLPGRCWAAISPIPLWNG